MPRLINTEGSRSASTLMHLFSKDKHTQRDNTGTDSFFYVLVLYTGINIIQTVNQT